MQYIVLDLSWDGLSARRVDDTNTLCVIISAAKYVRITQLINCWKWMDMTRNITLEIITSAGI